MNTLQGTQEYLARLLPFSEDGSTFINIHWTFRKEGADRPLWTGRGTRTVAEAVKAVEFALKGNDTIDIYACMSSQREAIEQVTANGWKYFKPVRSQQNAHALKSLFIDIDFKGGDHGYDTPAAAVSALMKFIQDVGLPDPSMVVKSGGGLHVYWAFCQYLTPAEWTPLAFALAEATKKHGLKCDSQCTIDSARVLRVPGTFNRKTGEDRPVTIGLRSEGDYTIERLTRVLEPYMTHGTLALPPRAPIIGISDLAAGIDTERSAPISIKSVAMECGFIRDAILTGGKSYTNPEWNLTTLIATFCEDSRKVAHLMSSAHPGYSQADTDDLFNRKEREKEEKGLGWPACRTISGSGCKACQTCPHFTEGKSPLNFGKRVQIQLPAGQVPPITSPHLISATPGVTSADLPNGYSREPTGIITRLMHNPDGTSAKIAVCNYPMTNPWLQKTPWALNFTTTTDHPQQVAIPLEVIGTNEMRKTLQSQGLMLHGPSVRLVEEFFVSWIEKLKETKNAVVSTSPFGWNTDRGKLEGFVFGGHVWTPTGSRVAPTPDAVLNTQYAPVGEIECWKEAARLITNQKRPALDAIVASAFAAPLVRFTNQEGLLMSAFSQESGIGKTTALKVAQAVWGDPIRAMQGLKDTQNSVFGKIGAIRSLPLYWDEMKTDEDTRRFVSIIFELTGGREKSRMRADSSLRDRGTWQTLLVSASNDSILEAVTANTKTNTAGIYRMFEYTVEPGSVGQIAPSEASRIIGRLRDNYGKPGLEYAMWLGKNHQRVEAEVAAFHKELDDEVRASNDERFWTALVTVICMGARYARELNFCEINEGAMRAFMLTTLGNMRKERSDQPVDMKDVMNVSNVFAKFLNWARARHTLYTNRIWVSPGKPPKGVISPQRPTDKLDGIYVHVGLEDKIMRVSSLHLTDWLAENGYSRHIFTQALEREFKMKTLRGRIGSGTDMAGFTEYLLEIDLAGTPHANFIDET